MIIESPSQLKSSGSGSFIVIEGVNGAGKGTLITALSNELKSRNIGYRLTREPGATELGKTLRNLLLEHKGNPPHPTTELLLFGADRSEHVQRIIKPALSSGELVISDRYFYSTLAFQGYGRKLDLDLVSKINQIATDGVLPDLVILLDLDPAEGLKRTNRRAAETQGSSESDAFEREALEFHTRIRRGFLDIAQQRPEPFVIIDAAQSQLEVFTQARLFVNKLAGGE